MKVTYIYHSGFLVETAHYVFVFDYYKGDIPPYDKNKKVVVFSSHSHGDHFSKKIFQEFAGATFVLSDDIPANEPNTVFVAPNQTITVDGVKIETLKSTDEGVAFFITADDKTIFHAGDLNLWMWEGEPEGYNQTMKQNFENEVAKIKGREIDLAFLPLDPRQEKFYPLGFDFYMKNLHIKKVFPMHMWEKYELIHDFLKLDQTKPYRDNIVPITRPGENFVI